MGRLGSARPKPLQVFHPNAQRSVIGLAHFRKYLADRLLESIRIAFGAKIQDQLAGTKGGIQTLSQLGHNVIAHHIDDRQIPQSPFRSQGHF